MEPVLSSRPATLDAAPLTARIGMIILATDHTTEPDFRALVADDETGLYVARIHYANPVTPENLAAMQPELTRAAGLILPGEPVDAIMYSCMSASVVIGDEEVTAAIRAGKPGVTVITPAAASVAALKALGARRISILTPYSITTTRPVGAYFEKAGFTLDRLTCLGLEDDREMARIAPDDILEQARLATDPASDALFISCTAVRAARIVPALEAAIGKPVVSSNLATAWACRGVTRIHPPDPALGRLMALPCPGV